MGALAQTRLRVEQPLPPSGGATDPVYDHIERHGYAPCSLAYFYLRRKCTALMHTCIGVAIALTAGATRRKKAPIKEWAVVPTSEVLKATGREGESLRDSRRSIEIALASACEMGFLERRKSESDGRSWEYRVAYWNWESIPDYVRSARTEEDETKPQADSAEEAPAETAAPSRVLSGKPYRLRAGKAKPTPLPEPVSKVIYRNAGTADLILNAETEGGTLFVDVDVFSERNLANSESPDSLSPTEVSAKPLLSPSFRPAIERIQAELEEKLGPLFVSRFGTPLTPSFCREIASRMQSATVDQYLALCRTNLQRKSHIGTGIFLCWADDAAKAALQLSELHSRELEQHEAANSSLDAELRAIDEAEATNPVISNVLCASCGKPDVWRQSGREVHHALCKCPRSRPRQERVQ